MNIQITSRKFRAKDSLKDFITSEVSSLEKVYEDILDIDVILSYENNINSTKEAELIMKIPGRILTSKEASDDFKKSIALAVEKLEKQLSKIKSKRIDNKRIENKLAEKTYDQD